MRDRKWDVVDEKPGLLSLQERLKALMRWAEKLAMSSHSMKKRKTKTPQQEFELLQKKKVWAYQF